MWPFTQEDPELRALKKQLKEIEAATKRAKIESEARIRQIQEDARQWHAENEARSRAQREDFFRQMEELAQQSGQTVEQLYEQVRAKMQEDLDRLTGKIDGQGDQRQASKEQGGNGE